MQQRIFSALFLSLISVQLLASGDPVPAGGRALGMGNAVVTTADAWALFNNVSGIADAQSPSLLAAFDSRYQLPGMQSLFLGGVYPTKYGTAGLSIIRFGDDLYSEHQLGIAYAHQISRVQLGIKVNYVQIHVSDWGTCGVLAFEFGGLTRITPELTFGAHIYNFNQAKLADYQDERIPTVMKAGLAYQPFSKLIFAVETEKDVEYPATFRVGAEYEIVKRLYVRTGLSTQPYGNHFGIGFRPKHFQFDYALRTHPALGLSHHLSLTYQLPKRQKNA